MTAPHYRDGSVTVLHGDALDLLPEIPTGSVDAVVTDPPYGIGFMGKAWDGPGGMLGQLATGQETRAGGGLAYGGTHSRGYAENDPAAFQAWAGRWAAECLRVLRPGGHLVTFGSSRTWHRLAVAVEDAGFEIRDSIAWLYGQGFPKSLDVERATGSEEWAGWGTALKPAFEPIVVARKALTGTVAANVTEHRTGALNVDGCRVPISETDRAAIDAKHAGMDVAAYVRAPGASLNLSANPIPLRQAQAHDLGRWPTNVVLAEEAAEQLDAETGVRRAGAAPARRQGIGYGGQQTGTEGERRDFEPGGASRYFPTFRWEAKAPTSERPRDGDTAHPTVKPLDLMRWIVRLVTPPGGLVLDPFAGSGTTAEACVVEGFRCLTIEREAAYLPLIVGRLSKPIQGVLL